MKSKYIIPFKMNNRTFSLVLSHFSQIASTVISRSILSYLGVSFEIGCYYEWRLLVLPQIFVSEYLVLWLYPQKHLFWLYHRGFVYSQDSNITFQSELLGRARYS